MSDIPSNQYATLARDYIKAAGINTVNGEIAIRLFAKWLDERAAGETRAVTRDAEHCDFPDCEQHWTYVVDLALAAMATFHATFQPDEEDADLTPRTTSEAFRAFVDAHARLVRIRGGAEPPYRVRGFWSPCRRYIASACVSMDNITLVDDDGRVWEPTGPEQDMAQPLHPKTPSPHKRQARCPHGVAPLNICERCD